MPNEYDIQDIVRVTGKFAAAANSTVFTDPTTVNFHLESPDGSVTSSAVNPPTTSATIIRSDTGEFYVDVATTGSGRYEYRWTSTGALSASEEGGFLVRIQAVTT